MCLVHLRCSATPASPAHTATKQQQKTVNLVSVVNVPLWRKNLRTSYTFGKNAASGSSFGPSISNVGDRQHLLYPTHCPGNMQIHRPPRTVVAALAVCCCTAAAFSPPITFAMASSMSPVTQPRSRRYGSTPPASQQASIAAAASTSASTSSTRPHGFGAGPTRDLRARVSASAGDAGMLSWHRLRSRKTTTLSSASCAGCGWDEKDPVQHVRGGATAVVEQQQKTSTARVAFYLAIWYSFTIGYNVYNKATLNRISAPWTLGTVQLAIGSVYVCGIWLTGLRKAPKLNRQNMKAVLPLAVLHTTAHIAAVVALSVGALGYFQIVKVGLVVWQCILEITERSQKEVPQIAENYLLVLRFGDC